MTVVDFHSHILPNIDDGSTSVDMSLEMLRVEAKQGIRHVIATPHFYPLYDTPARFIEKRNHAFAQLLGEMTKENGLPQVSLGAEVYFFRGMNQSEALNQLTIAGGRCILIEMPPVPWTNEIYRELEEIYKHQGIIPIVAHIDRYVRPYGIRSLVNLLIELPVLIQANAEFFLDKRTAGMAMRLLKEDKIHLLGSDCHNLSTRKPNLEAALNHICGQLGNDALLRIQSYESKILNAE